MEYATAARRQLQRRIRPVTDHVVEVGGRQLRVRVDGNTGPVVVLCSGLGGRALHWRDTVTNLAEDHTVVRFDRPGITAETIPAPDARQMLRSEADRIGAALEVVGRSDPVVVVGHSIGGFYAEAFARLYPERTRALLLLDSSIAHRRRLTLPLRTKLAVVDGAVATLAKLHLRVPLARAGLMLVQRRRPDGLDAPMMSEICRAASTNDIEIALLSEYAAYHEIAEALCDLRASHPLTDVRCTVATAHTGWYTRRWRAQQVKLAENLGAEHITLAPARHLVMIDQPHRTANLIRAVARSDSPSANR